MADAFEGRNFVLFNGEKEKGLCMGKKKKKGSRQRGNQLLLKRAKGDTSTKSLVIRKDEVREKQGEVVDDDFSEALEGMYNEHEPIPLQIDNSANVEEASIEATKWVQANMIKLGQQFGWPMGFCL
uniref:Putative ovule protein n=1 Tax=Solanum chacoense TaxID=4108 RepID=A0A0V0HJ71_SOLCH